MGLEGYDSCAVVVVRFSAGGGGGGTIGKIGGVGTEVHVGVGSEREGGDLVEQKGVRVVVAAGSADGGDE